MTKLDLLTVDAINLSYCLPEGLKIDMTDLQNQTDPCVWVNDRYGNGLPCYARDDYQTRDLEQTIERVEDGQSEAAFWRSPRGIAQAHRESEYEPI